MKKKIISSGFETIDSHEGGFKRGHVFIARTCEPEGAELQDYICTQTRQLALDSNLKVFIITLQMNKREFITELISNQSPQTIQQMSKTSIYIAERNSFNSVKEIELAIPEFIENEEIDIVVIDGIDSIVPTLDLGYNEDETDLLIKIAKKTNCVLIVSDYENNLTMSLNRPDEITEMEIKTDIRDTVQAAIYSNDKKTIIDDLYGLWRIFDKTLKDNEKQ